jgi:GDP-D-mannose dehydratase
MRAAFPNCSSTSLPDEIYHRGAQSRVRVSFDIPEYTGDITARGTARLLDAIREGIPAGSYKAASSETYVSRMNVRKTNPRRFTHTVPTEAWRFVVEQDGVDGKQAVAFARVYRHPVAVELRALTVEMSSGAAPPRSLS